MNTFSDDNVMPYPFDMRTVPGINRELRQLAPRCRSSRTLTLNGGFPSTGNSGLNDTNYYSWGVNGALTKLAGSHSLKTGADYRIIGVDAMQNGQSAGSYTFNGVFTRAGNAAANNNAIADLLLGYPSAGTLALPSPFNQYVKYYAWFVQDDWRVNDKLTVNYGIRLEHETGLAEENNQLVVGFDRNAVSPLNVTIPADPVAGTPARQVRGGLMFAGQNGANEQVGDPPAVKMSPRVGVAYSRQRQDRGPRGGYGLFWAPWQSGLQSTPGYSQTTTLQQDTLTPITSINNPFPTGLTPISGNSLGLLTGTSSAVTFIDQTRDAPRVHQYSVDMQRQLGGDMSIGLTYMGSMGRHLTWGGTGTGSVNINQLDPRFLPLNNVNGVNALTQNVPNPFFGTPGAGSFATRATIPRNQLLRPFPQFDNVNMIYSTLARSQVRRRRDLDQQARHRLVGRPHQLHLQPPLRQPVRAGQLLLELARHPEQLHGRPGVVVLQSRRRVRPQPARLAAQAGGEPDHPAAVRFGPALADQRRRQRDRRRLDGVVRHPDAERLPDRRQPEHQQHQPARPRPAPERGAGSRCC